MGKHSHSPASARPTQTSPYVGKRFAPVVDNSAAGFSRASSAYDAAAGKHWHGHGGGAAGSPAGKKRHTALFVVLGVIIALVILLGVYAAVLGSSAIKVVGQAKALVPTAQRVLSGVKSGDTGTLAADAQELQAGVEAIQSETSGVAWDIAEFIPVYGQDVASARTLLAAADGAVANVLVPMANTLAANPISSLIQDGNINGTAVKQLCDMLAGVTPAIKEALTTFSGVGTFHISQINDAIEQVRGPLNTVNKLLDENGDAIRMLPDMLGCNGARNYLVIAMNNVEVRANGGFPGAMCLVTIDGGAISYGEVLNSAGINIDYDNPVPITEEEMTIFGASLGAQPGNMGFTPDFSRSGELWSQAWLRDYGLQIDGVFALDPVLFGRILNLTGQSVQLSDGTVIDGGNIAKILQHDTYWEYSWSDYDETTANAMMDARYAEVANSGVQLIKDNLATMDKTAMLGVLQQGIKEGRFLGWLHNPAEETLLEHIGCAGKLNADPTHPVVGVYLNDDTWSKISWWLSLQTDIISSQKNIDGTTTYQLTTTLTNTMTGVEADTASQYIKGGNPMKRDNSDAITWIYLTAPAGGFISNISVNGTGILEMSETSYEGVQMYYGLSQLLCGEYETVSYSVTVSAQAENDLVVEHTPLAQES